MIHGILNIVTVRREALAARWKLKQLLPMILGVSLLGACGAQEGDESPEGNISGVDEPALTWSEMDPTARGTYMMNTVMPEMTELFQGFNAEYFAEFDCSSCHGENAQAVGFQMPNGLTPLDPAALPQMFGSDDPVHQFMVQEAWPRMAELLDYPLFDPETGQGFSCFGCHEMAQTSP